MELSSPESHTGGGATSRRQQAWGDPGAGLGAALLHPRCSADEGIGHAAQGQVLGGLWVSVCRPSTAGPSSAHIPPEKAQGPLGTRPPAHGDGRAEARTRSSGARGGRRGGAIGSGQPARFRNSNACRRQRFRLTRDQGEQGGCCALSTQQKRPALRLTLLETEKETNKAPRSGAVRRHRSAPPGPPQPGPWVTRLPDRFPSFPLAPRYVNAANSIIFSLPAGE